MKLLKEYLLSKNKVKPKNIHKKNEIYDNSSLNKLCEIYTETYNEIGEREKQCVEAYDSFIKQHTCLEKLIDYIADITEKHITGAHLSYIAFNIKQPNTHKFNAKRYIITIRFNEKVYMQLTIWDGYKVIGFNWTEELTHRKSWTLDFTGETWNKFAAIENKNGNFFGDVDDNEVIDAIIDQIETIIRVTYK